MKVFRSHDPDSRDDFIKYLLFLVLAVLVGWSCYEDTLLLLKKAADERQLSGLNGQLNALDTQNKQRALADGRMMNEIALLKKQVSMTRSALAEAKEKAIETRKIAQERMTAPAGRKGKPVVPSGPPPSNDLGTITTVDGRTFENCHLIMVEASSIVFTHADGIMDLPYPQMQPALQKRFHYDPKQGPSLSDDQVQFDEAQRQAAEPFDGGDE